MISKRRKWSLMLAGAFAAFALVTLLTREREPSYNGHRFSEWVLQISPSDSTASPPFQPAETEVRAAILALGTNNLPLLVRWVSFDSSRSIFIPIFNLMPVWFNRLSIFDPVIVREEEGHALGYSAEAAFKIIGPAGAPAIPRLERTIRRGSLVPGGRALHALESIGESALPAIISAAALTNCPSRYLAIRSLWAHTNNPSAYRFLTNALNDPDPYVSEAAAEALKAQELY